MKTALILIDIQNDYFPEGKMELKGSVEAGMQAKKLLHTFREKKLPIIHIQHFSTKPGATFFIPDTEGVNIHKFVTPYDNEKVFIKNFPNSFRNTGLGDYLKENGITKLIICGMMTHMCIDATTRAAFDLGYECVVVKDACATRNLMWEDEIIPAEHVHGAFLAALGSVYAKILSLEQTILLLN